VKIDTGTEYKGEKRYVMGVLVCLSNTN
jgi:hypothetical protein